MPAVTLSGQITGGPFFDDLTVGQVFDTAPSMTLTPGAAATHQAILGDRLRLALDAELATAVVGATAPLAHPALVCDVAIGQSTVVTQRVKANLFYRGLTFHRFPVIGDTLFKEFKKAKNPDLQGALAIGLGLNRALNNRYDMI